MSKVEIKLVPELRFPGFGDDWEEKKLEDITRINQGLQISISNRYTEKVFGSYFYITNEFLKKGSKKEYYILNPSEFVICNEEDILMTRTGNTGEVVTNVSGAFHNNFFKIKYSTNQIAKDFFVAFLRLRRTQINILKLAGTSTIPDLNHSDFYRIKINLPCIPEQTRISNLLTAVDKRLSLLQKKKEAMEQYKEGIMQKIFSRELWFKDDQGNDFPDWDEKKLGEFYSFISTNSLSRDKLNYEKGYVKNIHYGDIHTKFKSHFNIEFEKVPYINSNVDLSRTSKESFLYEGDIIFADALEDYYDIGKAIEVVNINNENVLSGLHTLLARRKSDSNILIGFTGHLIKSEKVRLDIMKIAQGTKVLGISSKRLSNIFFITSLSS